VRSSPLVAGYPIITAKKKLMKLRIIMILFSLWVVILSKPLKAETDLTELD
jgi:hypothetical protein